MAVWTGCLDGMGGEEGTTRGFGGLRKIARQIWKLEGKAGQGRAWDEREGQAWGEDVNAVVGSEDKNGEYKVVEKRWGEEVKIYEKRLNEKG